MDLSGTDNQNQPMSDDQELAKALAGVTEETNNMEASADPGLVQPLGVQPASVATPDPMTMATPTLPDPMTTTGFSPATDEIALDPALASVKQAALEELRPLIDKLDVEPEEKFNTYLLLIRSTDDKDLIAPAHEAAKAITDEAKKAQALLDIIKEIDFLSNPNK